MCTTGSMKTRVKRVPFEFVAAVMGIGVASALLGAIFGFALLMQRRIAHQSTPAMKNGSPQHAVTNALAEQGRHLFLMNCAHCHADDATGDEGPDLHGVRKSDARITAIIKNGIKGEMPKFGQKLKDEDVRALIAFLRTLK